MSDFSLPKLEIFVFLFMTCLFTQQLFAQPSINFFSPVSGAVGTIVTITGNNFDGIPASNIVYFGAVKAVVNAATGTSLTVTVPAGATYAPVTVTTNGLTAYSSNPFAVTFLNGGFITPGSFVTKSDSVLFTSSAGVYGLAVSDLDGDGKSDVIAVNGEFQFYVLKNKSSNGVISFAPTVTLFNTGGPFNVTAGDLNGDGKPDLVIVNYITRNFSVLKNTSANGTISFTAIGNYALGSYAGTVAICNINGDGKPDIVASSDISLKIFKNTGSNGNISFAMDFEYDHPGGYITGDLDGDGKTDIAIGNNSTKRIEILRNISTSSSILFDSSMSIPADNNGVAFIHDINGDGKPELAVNSSNNLSVYRNTGSSGNISFASPVAVNTDRGVGGSYRTLADMDGDGKPDMILNSQSGNAVAILRNGGTNEKISFNDFISYYSRSTSFASVADIDGDGKPDIITSNLGSRSNSSISVLRNQSGEPQITATGSNPVNGNVEIKVFYDSSVQTYNGYAYAQRHYDVQPESNAGTSTVTVKLLFTQQDFINFNSYSGHGNNLPTGPSDQAGIAALRIFQYHGFSASGMPAGYPGPAIEINPDDTSIVWNTTKQCWEISFDITGFSGFFIGTSGSTTLPLKLLSFTGTLSGSKSTLNWITADEINVSYFEVQRSVDGFTFITLNKVEAAGINGLNKNYYYTDTIGNSRYYYYRLKMKDRDGSFTLSSIVTIITAAGTSNLTVYPNPAKNFVNIQLPFTSHAASLSILDLSGKLIRTIKLENHLLQSQLSVKGLSAGHYTIVWSDGQKTVSRPLAVE